MAEIGSPKSLSRIAKYCRDNNPVLWDYKEPNPELVKYSEKVYIAIANNIAKSEKQKAVKMLNNVLQTDNVDIKTEAIRSLNNLGVHVKKKSGE